MGVTVEQVTKMFGTILTDLLAGIKAINFASFYTITMKVSKIKIDLDFEAVLTEIQKFLTTCEDSIASLFILITSDPTSETAMTIEQAKELINTYVQFALSSIKAVIVTFTVKLSNGIPSGMKVNFFTMMASESLENNPAEPNSAPVSRTCINVLEQSIDINYSLTSGAAVINNVVTVPTQAA